ncbi:hypothetical protein YC2023_061827 [Brassica napus]
MVLLLDELIKLPGGLLDEVKQRIRWRSSTKKLVAVLAEETNQSKPKVSQLDDEANRQLLLRGIESGSKQKEKNNNAERMNAPSNNRVVVMDEINGCGNNAVIEWRSVLSSLVTVTNKSKASCFCHQVEKCVGAIWSRTRQASFTHSSLQLILLYNSQRRSSSHKLHQTSSSSFSQSHHSFFFSPSSNKFLLLSQSHHSFYSKKNQHFFLLSFSKRHHPSSKFSSQINQNTFSLLITYMTSSSFNTFEGVDDEIFDQYFDDYFDQQFDQTLENLSIGNEEDQRKKRKKRIHIERNREEGDVRYGMIISVKLQHILKIYFDEDLE